MLFVGGLAAEAFAGFRNSGVPRSSYVPRSSTNGVSPGTFGRSDPLQGRIERDCLQIRRFQEQTRARARQREVLRELRGPITEQRPAAPSNRLTDRLRPQVEALGNTAPPAVRQADRPLFVQPPTGPAGPPRRGLSTPNLGLHLKSEPYAHIDRHMR